MKLSNTHISIAIWSQDHRKLAKWYVDNLGFKVKSEINFPNDQCIDFDFGDSYFSVGYHDGVHGKTSDPYRKMIGLNVPSVTGAYEEIKDKDVHVIAPPFEAPPGGFWCMTIEDPEGNILQFFGQK